MILREQRRWVLYFMAISSQGKINSFPFNFKSIIYIKILLQAPFEENSKFSYFLPIRLNSKENVIIYCKLAFRPLLDFFLFHSIY